MPNENLFELFRNRFPDNLDVPFIETMDGRIRTYREFEAESARFARLFSTQGIQPGDRVMVQVAKSPPVLFLYLACLRAGFIYLPLNTGYRQRELEYFFANAAPRVIVCDPENYALWRTLDPAGTCTIHTLDSQGQGTLIEQSRNQAPDFPVVDCRADDIAAILYTSGTTGRPKGAMITHRNLASNGLALHRSWGWQPGDVLLHALPIYHAHGLFVACHCVLLNGGAMLFLPAFDAATVIRLLPRATVFMGVPTYYTRLLAQPELTRQTCRRMRLFISGSAPLLERTFNEFRDRTGHAILERYGMTETEMNTSNPLHGARIAGTVGKPLPGVSLRIVDEEGREVQTGAVGQLLVKGDNVFKGYWRLPEQTAREFTADGFFKTGDLARIDANGYLTLVGRAKDLIITGGLNVYPKEVEAVIDEIDGVFESAVIGLPDPDFGEAVAAVVVREPGREDITAARIIARLKIAIAGFKVPKQVFFAEQLPVNTMGKVQKNILREQYAGSHRET
ncbi:MAG: malonyl-CoA synthase [Candidatus Competibacteraceae bacterium]